MTPNHGGRELRGEASEGCSATYVVGSPAVRRGIVQCKPKIVIQSICRHLAEKMDYTATEEKQCKKHRKVTDRVDLDIWSIGTGDNSRPSTCMNGDLSCVTKRRGSGHTDTSRN